MKKNTNYIDKSFDSLVSYIKERNLEEVIEVIKHNFYYYRNTNRWQFDNIIKYYNNYKLWGEIDLEKNNFQLIEKNAKTLVEHIADFEWLYGLLEDYRSKSILIAVLYYWLMLDDKKIKQLQDNVYSQYFDLDIIKCDHNEIFVDVGAYTGDTLVNYIKTFGKECYKKFLCYEIVPSNIKYIEENIKIFDLENVIIRDKGASDKNDKLFIENDNVSSITKLTDRGEFEVETVKIDDDIKGKITFIKMDIEGGELKALIGLEKKIKKYKPKLAISVYHSNDDLWQIPRFIHKINSNYKFYLRYYGGSILPTEYILYAI